MIERIFGDGDSEPGVESQGTCPRCGKLDGLSSSFTEENGRLIFEKSECECGYEV